MATLNLLADAQVGETWMLTYQGLDGEEHKIRLEVIEFGGRPVVVWDQFILSTVEDFPRRAPIPWLLTGRTEQIR